MGQTCQSPHDLFNRPRLLILKTVSGRSHGRVHPFVATTQHWHDARAAWHSAKAGRQTCRPHPACPAVLRRFRELSQNDRDKLHAIVTLDCSRFSSAKDDADFPRFRGDWRWKSWLKTALYMCTMLSVTFVCAVCFAEDFDQNNASHPQNSPSSKTGRQSAKMAE